MLHLEQMSQLSVLGNEIVHAPDNYFTKNFWEKREKIENWNI